MTRGWSAIINDSLISRAMLSGAVLLSLGTAVAGTCLYLLAGLFLGTGGVYVDTATGDDRFDLSMIMIMMIMMLMLSFTFHF